MKPNDADDRNEVREFKTRDGFVVQSESVLRQGWWYDSGESHSLENAVELKRIKRERNPSLVYRIVRRTTYEQVIQD